MTYRPQHLGFLPAHQMFHTWGAGEVTAETAQQAVDTLTTPPPADAGYDEYISYFNKSAEGLRTLLVGKDARTTAAILQARLQNMKKDKSRYAKIPVVGKLVSGFLDGKIRTMEAEYNSAAVLAQEEQYAANTKMILSTLAVGIGGLGALALLQYIAFTRARTRAIQ